jgi:serine protease Do
MDRLIEYGRVSRGFLGVDIQTLSPKLARAIGLPEDSTGVLVTSVSADSAAEKAGLKYGDVILEFDGQKVADRSRLQLIVAQTAPQTRATLRVLRPEDDGKTVEKTLMAVLTERPQQPGDGNGQSPPKRHTPAGKDSLDGVEVTDLDARIRRELDVPSQIHGALVTNVDPASNSAEAGLRRGDVILEIERHPVRGADDAVAMSEKSKGDHVLLRVWTPNEEGEAGSTHYLAVDNMLHK